MIRKGRQQRGETLQAPETTLAAAVRLRAKPMVADQSIYFQVCVQAVTPSANRPKFRARRCNSLWSTIRKAGCDFSQVSARCAGREWERAWDRVSLVYPCWSKTSTMHPYSSIKSAGSNGTREYMGTRRHCAHNLYANTPGGSRNPRRSADQRGDCRGHT